MNPKVISLKKEGKNGFRQIIDTLAADELVAINYPGRLWGIIGAHSALRRLQRVKDRWTRPFSGQAPAEAYTQIFDPTRYWAKYAEYFQDREIMEKLFSGQAFVRGSLQLEYRKDRKKWPWQTFDPQTGTFHLLSFSTYPLYADMEQTIYEALGQQPWLLTSCNPAGMSTHKRFWRAWRFARNRIRLIAVSGVKSKGVPLYPVVTIEEKENVNPSCPASWLTGRFLTFEGWLKQAHPEFLR